MTDAEYATIRARFRQLQDARNKALQEKTAALKRLKDTPKNIADRQRGVIDAPRSNEIDMFNFISGRRLVPTKAKQPIRGGGKLRSRWVDENNRIWEWDYLHGEFEVFDASGKHHLGAGVC